MKRCRKVDSMTSRGIVTTIETDRASEPTDCDSGSHLGSWRDEVQ